MGEIGGFSDPKAAHIQGGREQEIAADGEIGTCPYHGIPPTQRLADSFFYTPEGAQIDGEVYHHIVNPVLGTGQ